MSDKYICFIAALIAVCYSVFIISHVVSGQSVPNGIVFGSCVGALCVLAGVKYEKMKQTGYFTADLDASEQDDPSDA